MVGAGLEQVQRGTQVVIFCIDHLLCSLLRNTGDTVKKRPATAVQGNAGIQNGSVGPSPTDRSWKRLAVIDRKCGERTISNYGYFHCD